MPHCNGFRFADSVPGRERIKILLAARGLNVGRFAEKYNRIPSEVSMTLSGTRAYPEIRDDLAAELGLARKEIDELIDGPGKAAAAEGGGAIARPRAPAAV